MTISLKLSYYLSALLLLVAPLFYAGKTSESIFVIQCLGAALLFFVFWGGIYFKKLTTITVFYLFVSLTLSLAYLLPIPMEYWQQLPGRGLYVDSYRWLAQQGASEPALFLSIVPSETALSLLMLVPTLAIFLSAVSVPDREAKRLVYVLLFVAAAQAALGTVQYASGNPDFLFGIQSHGKNAQGMYTNRDHFVALMEMSLPLLMGLMLYCVGRDSVDRHRESEGFPVNQLLLFACATIIVLVGAIFSRSRAGIFLIMLLVFLSSVVFSRHVGGKQSVSLTVIFLVIAGGIATTVGLIPVLNRFIVLDPSEDGRWPIFETTISVMKSFFPLGSGPGTFAEVYRASQPIDQLRYINHAHNDYLELLLEMGAAGAFVIVGFLLVYLGGWIRLRGHIWNRMHFIQIGAGLAIFAILLHSLVDFNFHTPANFIVFAFLAGIFMRKKAPLAK